MCEEKEEDDSSALKIVSMHQYKNSKITLTMQRKTDYSDLKQYKQHKYQQNKNTVKTKKVKKNNWTSDKQTKSHSRKRVDG